MKNKNLLILCPSFPDKESQFYGGIFVKEYVNSIKKYFNKVYVISPIASTFLIKTEKEKICKDYKYDNVEVYYPKHFHLPIKYFRERLGDNQFKVVNKLIQKLNLKFDIIHTHFTWPSGYVGVKLKEKYGSKLIITGHGYDVYDLPFRNNYWKEKTINTLKKADIVTTVSQSNEKKLNKLGFKNIKIIPNGYNNKVFFYIKDKNKLKNKLNISKDKKILLSVGNLIDIKNHKTLILACKELLKIRNDFVCYIIGDGPLKNELQNLINENNLQDYVKLLGRKKTEEVAKYMNIADLFVLPSLSEGNPTVMFEALGSGLPVIGSKTAGGLPEIIKSEKYGLILKNPTNIFELVELINIGLYKNWDKNYIIDYSKYFTWNNIGRQYLNLYNKFKV